ncbi:MAG: SprB repeat-containing protein, partial [Bacteroidota bacterium]
DGDGLIDLNDPDCDCPVIAPVSLIPNPSFEDTLCCPTAFGQLNCTQNWVSGTNTSSDFFHTCDFSAPTQVDVPLPLPSGNAYTGFINNGAYQEFVGTCLPNPLQAGTNYLLNAEVGFGVDIGTAYSGGFSPFSLTLYGATNCADLPVASGTNGCPSLASPDWIVLGSVTLNGSEEWVAGAINFTPAQDINAIILGPDCGTSSPPAYYFLDNVKIGEVPDFGGISLASTGDPCQGTLVLNAPQYANPDLQYQWYRDGVALPGETGLDFLVPAGAGATYQLRIRDGLFCDTAQIVLPLGNALVQATISGGLEICQGEQSTLDAPSGFVSYQWETPSGLVLGAQLNASEAGQYILIATDINACEARDTVDLIVNPVPLVQVDQQDVRCFGERNGQIRLSASAAQAPYQYSLDNGNSISNGMFNGLIAGPYAYLVIDANGCETTGNITLFEPDLLELNLDLLQDAGCDEPNGLIQLSASGGTQQYSIRWADDNSSLFQRADLAEGTYEARLTDANGCEVLESYQIQNDRK